MSSSDARFGRRFGLALLLSALAIGALPAVGLALSLTEAGSTAELETCHACRGCENGACDESSPFDAGDHCCPSRCLDHTVGALPAPPATSSAQRCEPAVAADLQRLLQAPPYEIYQPPRA